VSSAVDGTDDDMLWKGNKNLEMLRVRMRKMNAPTVTVDTMTLIGSKGRKDLTCFVY
jgi:hypothetical protein